MGALSLEKACELLGTGDVPGNERELMVLGRRLGELQELNGEEWIRANRRMLLEQWRFVVASKTIG